MNLSEKALWDKIKNFELDDIESSLMFSDRLARENGWTKEFALRCIFEYKKFIFLICTGSHPMTPSDEVDQVWHLHLIYTWSYWKEFCGETLGKEIHHGPTKGGGKEQVKYNDLYNRTLDAYRNYWGKPPADIWPPPQKRFASVRFVRVNAEKNVIVKNPFKIWK